MGEGEIARDQQFLLFPQCFLLNQVIVSPFVYIFDISLLAAELEKRKIGISAKGLNISFKKEFEYIPSTLQPLYKLPFLR